MSNIRKGFFYAAYVLVTTIFFAYYLFPADAAKKYILENLAATRTGLSFTIDRVTATFPPGLRLQAVNFYHRGVPMLKAEQIRLVPGCLSLFSPVIDFVFKGEVYDGLVEGRGNITKNRDARQIKTDARFSAIKIEKIKALEDLSGLKMTGLLEGKADCNFSQKASPNLKAELVVTDGEIGLQAPFFNLDKFRFSQVKAEVALDDHRLKLKKCIIKGSYLEGTITGFVTLKIPLNRSVLNISGEVTPRPALIAALGDMVVGNKKIAGKNSFNVKLGGTLDKPEILLP